MLHSKHNTPLLAFAAVLLAACESPVAPNNEGGNVRLSSSQTTPTTFSGEATVVRAEVAGVAPITLVTTGPLSPSGGALNNTLVELAIDKSQTANLVGLEARVGHVHAVGQGKKSRSQATVADLKLDVNGTVIEASFLEALATAVCDAAGAATATAGSHVAELFVAGLPPITVAGQKNQTLTVGNLTIIINEQKSEPGSAGAADITVNALHVILNHPLTGQRLADVIVASAHADIQCGGLCSDQGDDFTTGGGRISATDPPNARRTFAVAGGKREGWGHLIYINKATSKRVKATVIDTYDHDPFTGYSRIEGLAEVNGVDGHRFYVDVKDDGEPGTTDEFHIKVPSAEIVDGGILGGGNIQFHDRPSQCQQ
jgi:hypothetical protein